MRTPSWIGLLLSLAVAPAQEQAQAQEGASSAPGETLFEFVIDGPPPPVEPAVINRDAEGRATIRAVRVDEPPRLDGVLDEAMYETLPAITGFLQQAPDEGAPATERTDAWITFDDSNLYVAGRIWDSAPESEWVANELRRDTRQLRQNDTFAVILDTFYDRRNAVAFYTNPLGALADFAITNEGNPNSDWNPVWDVRTGRFDGGWTVEMEIPFRSLRYRPGPSQVWGIQLRRNVRRKNEWAYITQVPISAGNGPGGIFRISAAATLVGIDAPSGSKNLEIKPYAIGGVATDLTAADPFTNQGSGDAGLDVKYGLTQNLTADFTFNTDFAQVEVDEQQVNLTRFNLFFPEKREFFLEGRGIFDFARGAFGGGFGGALRRQGGGFFGGGNAPTIFYSRRIGLQGGSIVPIVGGGRVTGKVGAFDVGAINMQADSVGQSVAATNFTVVRLKRDILRRSSVGAIFTNRSVALEGDGSSQAYGIDANFSFYENVNFLAYGARTKTPGARGRDGSWQGRFDYSGDLFGMQVEHLAVEDNFKPEVGFLRRDDFRRSYGTLRYSPRPRGIESIRQFRLEASRDYIESASTGVVETRQAQLAFAVELENSDRFGISLAENYEFLARTFEPAAGAAFAPGPYKFSDVELSYSPGAQRRLNGSFSVLAGEYFNGDIVSVQFRRGRAELTQRLSLEPTISFNWIDTAAGTFNTNLVVTRVNYTFTPRMFFSGLIQYNSNSNTLSSNLRLRWEYSPGSELFVVYTEDRETDPLRPIRYSDLRNRGFVIKMNRLFRF
ncbi:MAG: carbohydrate binding family 9 domain-containing protein [Acidobacteria bacterium]|nr:carbohydrate binding family 9 domain-containing protein [Acidobacteriota bacterium]